MAINPPVDATKTPEWAALQKHYDELQSEGISLKQWFADDAERVEKLARRGGPLLHIAAPDEVVEGAAAGWGNIRVQRGGGAFRKALKAVDALELRPGLDLNALHAVAGPQA